MIGFFDYSCQGWRSGKGRNAIWEFVAFDEKRFHPQYLISLDESIASEKVKHGYKLGIASVSSATNARSLKCSLIPGVPCSHSVNTLQLGGGQISHLLYQQVIFCSFCFDAFLRYRFGGVNISAFILQECPIPNPREVSKIVLNFVAEKSAQLSFLSRIFCPAAVKLRDENGVTVIPKGGSVALTPNERMRLRVILDAVSAYLYGLDFDHFKYILRDCDWSSLDLNPLGFDPKGFWRVDRDKPPELRQTVLSLVAFRELLEHGVDRFVQVNSGEGWMVPEALRLADYGLGHDDRAKEHQPVASRLGPRFYDWQLEQDVDESWEECRRHAELIRRIVPPPDDEPEAGVAEPPEQYQISMDL